MNLFRERRLILDGLLYFWNCNICRSLGWDQEKGCSDEEKPADCPQYVYNKLGAHFVAISQAAKDAKQ